MIRSLKPNTINVYAQSHAITDDRVTSQGFGYTTSKEPVVQTSYVWEGQLHGKEQCSNSRSTLKELAENLMQQFSQFPSEKHARSGIPGYSISFNAPNHARRLNFVEQRQFAEALKLKQ